MRSIPESIVSRRSIRRFTDQDIPDDLLRPVLESVRWAPSWGNSQCWEIITVRDRKRQEALAGTLSERNPATIAVKSAPVIVAICGALGKAGYYKGEPRTKFSDWFLFDLGLATQNLVLTAYSMGLGSVIVAGLDHDMARKILQVPEGFELAALVPLGFPDQQPGAPDRRRQEDYLHEEIFTSRG